MAERKNILPIGEGQYILGYENDFYYNNTLFDLELVDMPGIPPILRPKEPDDRFEDARPGSDINTDTRTIMKDFDRRQEMSDKYSGYFRYDNNIDDPLLMGFDIIIDGMSPLLKSAENKNSLAAFLQDYGTDPTSSLYELTSRIELHKEFVLKLSEIFKIDPTPSFIKGEQREDGFYINKVDGMDNFMKKIIDYKKDKLSIEIIENIRMSTNYLAELYNNLIYSYRTQRYMMPENLVRFNMTIELTDMRNYVAPSGSNNFITSPKSKVIIELYDCNFDFSTSKTWQDHITQAGMSAGVPRDFSWITFDIYYKSVRRTVIPSLISNSYKLDNRGSIFEKLTGFDMNNYLDNPRKEILTTDEIEDRVGSSPSIDDLIAQEKAKFSTNLDLDKLRDKRKLAQKQFMDSQRENLMKQLLNDAKDVINFRRMGLSLLDETPLAAYSNTILDALNGNFGTLKQDISDFITSEINKLRQKAFMELSNTLYEGRINEGDIERLYLNDINLDSEQKAIIEQGNKDSRYTPLKEKLSPVVYNEPEPSDKQPEGIAYEEPPYNRLMPRLSPVYEEGDTPIKQPEGVVYEEGGPILKYPDGVVYEEGGPILKYPDGVVYEEIEPPINQPEGVVYEEGESPIKEPDGVVYDNAEKPFKEPEGVVYDNAEKTFKEPDGVVYDNAEKTFKEPDGVVYEEGESPIKEPDGFVYDKAETPFKEPEGKLYDDPQSIINKPEGSVYDKLVEPKLTTDLGEIDKTKSSPGYMSGGISEIDKIYDGKENYEIKKVEGRVYEKEEKDYKLLKGEKAYEEGDNPPKKPPIVDYES